MKNKVIGYLFDETRFCKDEKSFMKVAKKLGIEDNLREKPLDTNGWLEEYKQKYKETKHV